MSDDQGQLPAVVDSPAQLTTAALRSSLAVPAMVAEAGDRAAKRFLEFFAASIENDNTRLAYHRAVCSFFAWLEEHGIGELADIEPFHVAAYLKALRVSDASDRAVKERTAARPTVKQHLAAIRMLFDWLVVGQILAINPAHAVRGPKQVVKRGKTPVLSEDQARHLLASIKVTRKVALPDGSEAEVPSLVGLRDRALIGVMVYSFARVSAVVAMAVEDYFSNGKRWWLRLHEKGGKRHEMPAHHKLEQFLDEYLDAAGIRADGKTPLFRSALGRTGILTDRPMHRIDAYQMVRRRTAAAGLNGKLGCHVSRATGITAYLEAGGTLENAQAISAHESPRTTKLSEPHRRPNHPRRGRVDHDLSRICAPGFLGTGETGDNQRKEGRPLNTREFHQIWIEQCDAAEGIKRRYGLKAAFDYLVAEKLLNFADAAVRHSEFARELPRFVARVRHMFTPQEMLTHLAGTEQEQSEYSADIEDDDACDNEDELLFESPVAAAERARQFATIKELLTATELGTS